MCVCVYVKDSETLRRKEIGKNIHIIVYHLLWPVESENPTDEYSCVSGRGIFP